LAERIPCINPRCRRTFKREGEPVETICGKCFRTLPESVRAEFRRCWREYRKWDRRITRTGDPLKADRMRDIRDRFGAMINSQWVGTIKPYFLAPERPEGLDALLEELNLRP
jgi:hypothetical protein